MITPGILFGMALLWIILAIKLGWMTSLIWVVAGLAVALIAGQLISKGARD